MRLNRRHFFAYVTPVFAFFAASARAFAQSTFGPPAGTTRVSRQTRGSGRVASLKDMLNAGLRARRPVEFKFIAEVVKLVEQKKLPIALVTETFHYARKKRRGYPFQYFQRALAIRATKFGVKLKLV